MELPRKLDDALKANAIEAAKRIFKSNESDLFEAREAGFWITQLAALSWQAAEEGDLETALLCARLGGDIMIEVSNLFRDNIQGATRNKS